VTAAVEAPEAVKRCSKCQEDKPLDAFPRDRSKPDGRQSYCRDCRRVTNRRWVKENPKRHRENTRRWQAANAEKVRDGVQRWRAANPERAWLSTIATTYRTRGVPLDPAAEGHVLSLYGAACHYCGGDRSGPYQRQLDHVLPVSRGGLSTAANLVPSCRSCNQAKRAMTAEEFGMRRATTAAEAEADELIAQLSGQSA
jgi:5-methylcytosine-specific restriction endonuclease McrA